MGEFHPEIESYMKDSEVWKDQFPQNEITQLDKGGIHPNRNDVAQIITVGIKTQPKLTQILSEAKI